MMYSLELQPTMEEIQPLRTIHVHRRAEHALWERFGDAQIGCAHSEMAERDLDVYGHRYGMGDHDECEAG